MTREEAVRLAQYFAYGDRAKHSYLPQTEEEAEIWQPHEWVIEALIEASRNEY